jgi:hypothetical protein
LYITVIDPDFANNMVSRMSDWFAEVGMDEAQIEAQTEQMRKGFSLNRQLLNLAFAPVGAAVLGLIAAAAAKRNPPME